MFTKEEFIKKYPNLFLFLFNLEKLKLREFKKSGKSDFSFKFVDFLENMEKTNKRNLFNFLKQDIINLIIYCFGDINYKKNDLENDIINRWQSLYGCKKIEISVIYDYYSEKHLIPSIIRPIDFLLYWRHGNNYYKDSLVYCRAYKRYKEIINNFL